MRLKAIGAIFLAVALSSTLVAVPASSRATGVGSGLQPVTEIEYPDAMHMLVTRTKGHDYLFTSSANETGAIRVFDIDNPGKLKQVAEIACGGNQALMTLSADGKTLIVAEGVAHGVDECFPVGEKGFYTIDVSNPRKPKPIGVALIPFGGHHITAHPTKPFVYVSHGIVAATSPSELQVFDVWSIKDPANPKYVTTGKVTGYHGPHDIAFNKSGSRAVMSSMSLLQVFDTSDPANPKELQVLQCPGCSHNHEAHFTPDDKHVVVSDEFGGGAPGACPVGALYFYEWNAEASPYMDLIGEWQPAEVGTPQGDPTNAGTCTSHVFDISDDGTKIAASWHVAGVRVIDITKMDGVGIGNQGTGPTELGWYVRQGNDAWSAKFDRTGRYVFVQDANHGLQVYKLDKP